MTKKIDGEKMKKIVFAGLIFMLLIGMQATYAEATLNIKTINPPVETANGGDGWEKGENIALNRYAEADNVVQKYDKVSNANDGDPDTFMAIGGTPSPKAWLGIDLGENYYIYEVHLKLKRLWLPSNKEQSNIELQFREGTKWKTIWSTNKMNNDIVEEYTIKCIGNKTGQVKLLKTESNGLWEDELVIYEVEVYKAIDVSPPTVKIISGPENGSIVKGSEKDGASFTFVWSGEDNAPKEDILYSYRLGKNAGWSEWTTNTEIKYKNFRSEGKYFFEVRAKDISGNMGNTDNRWFYIDSSKPNVEITWPKPGYFYLTLLGREILPWIELDDKSHAVVVGSGKLQVSASDKGTGVSVVALYLTDIDPNNPVESKGASDRYIFNIYNGEHTYKVEVFDKAGKSSSATIKINGIFTGIDPPGHLKVNTPPYQTTKPNGVSQGKTEKEYTFTCTAKDTEGDNIYYLFDWGDGSNTGWIGPYHSDETAKASHSWSKDGTYKIKVRVKDSHGNQGDWYAFTEIKIKNNNGNNQQNKDLNINKHVVVFRKTKPVSKPVLNRVFQFFNKPTNKQFNVNSLKHMNLNIHIDLTKTPRPIKNIYRPTGRT